MDRNDAGYVFWTRCTQFYPMILGNGDLLMDYNQESNTMKFE